MENDFKEQREYLLNLCMKVHPEWTQEQCEYDILKAQK